MKLAGYPSGRYTGGKTLRSSARPAAPHPKTRKSSTSTLQNLGFKTKFTLVTPRSCTREYCGTPAEAIDGLPERRAGSRTSAIPRRCSTWRFQRQEHRPQREQQLGVGEQPRNQQGDGRGRARRRHPGAPPMRGRRSTGNSSPRPWRSHSTGTSRQASSPKTYSASGDLWNTGQWDYNYTSLK